MFFLFSGLSTINMYFVMTKAVTKNVFPRVYSLSNHIYKVTCEGVRVGKN